MCLTPAGHGEMAEQKILETSGKRSNNSECDDKRMGIRVVQGMPTSSA
jgi:hypothetical protein